MLNWLGQDVKVGSVVFRGARQGNTSSHKIGVVESINEETRKARVAWKYECGGQWIRPDQGKQYFLEVPYKLSDKSKGNPDIGPLVVVPHGLLTSAENMIKGVEMAKAQNVPANEIDNFIQV
ncbi:hypothetical protein SEA_PHREDRICK_104 [Streptomyces phage Phredrick]|jgi:hypothetical protein|nr:hypothetical protein SEA_PHREDRICK_104 [Streptomyces phage Phredrick]